MKFTLLRQLRDDERGATALLFAILFMLLFAITAFVVDISTVASVRNRAQHALDAAGLAATESALTLNAQQEATNFFNANFHQGYLGANFDAVSVSVSADGTTYDYSTRGFVPFSLAQIVGARSGQDVVVSTQVKRDNSLLELALVMDSSLEMTRGASGGGTRLDAMKSAANGMIDTIYGSLSALPGSAVSLISYSDSVRFDPNVANNWLLLPYANTANFDGCMSNRRNGYDQTSTAPNRVNPPTLFQRYSGPFDVGNKVTVTFYPVNLPPRNIPYITQDTEAGVRVMLQGDFNTIYAAGRFTSEMDYIYTDQFNNLINKPEILRVDLGADYVRSFPDMKISAMFINEQSYDASCNVVDIPPERGGWIAYNSLGQAVGTNTFYGAVNGALFSTATVSAAQPFRYADIFPIDNGARDVWVDLRCGPFGNTIGARIRDNSDFVIYEFTHKPRCSLAQSNFFMNDKQQIKNYINSLAAAGPTRNNIGMNFGWYALSQNWRGVIQPGNNGLPRNNQPGLRKIAILLTQGRNLDPVQDDANFLATCNGMKAQGISVYTISFDADAAVSGLLSACATSGQYYNAPNTAQLTRAFQDIGNSIARLRITK